MSKLVPLSHRFTLFFIYNFNNGAAFICSLSQISVVEKTGC